MKKEPSLLDLVGEALSQLGYSRGEDPWTDQNEPPVPVEINHHLARCRSALAVRLPADYEAFLLTSKEHLIANGFLVPWPSARNIVELNTEWSQDSESGLTIFWQEESGDMYGFAADSTVSDGEGGYYGSFSDFLRSEIPRRISNANSRGECIGLAGLTDRISVATEPAQ